MEAHYSTSPKLDVQNLDLTVVWTPIFSDFDTIFSLDHFCIKQSGLVFENWIFCPVFRNLDVSKPDPCLLSEYQTRPVFAHVKAG